MRLGLIIALVFLVLIIGFGSLFYLTVISPSFVEKPILEKPVVKTSDLSGSVDTKIEDKHIQYLVNEIGGYKLHDDPITNEPAIIECVVLDTKEIYTVTIKDNVPVVTNGASSNPDIRLKAMNKVMLSLLASNDFNKAVVDYVNDGSLYLELLTDEKTLALKGYKSIYDSLMEDSNMPTGQFILSFDRKLVRR